MKSIPNLPDIERRFAGTPIELRADDGEPSRKVRGYAAVFDRSSVNLGFEDYQFFEIIERGAFDDVLNDNVVALFNHDDNLILARSVNGTGTLKIGTDDTGLWYEFDAPNTAAGNDLLESVKRGDISSSSFAFSLTKDGQKWEEKKDGEGPTVTTRTITKVARLYDVSPVTSPAYPDATVALRSLEDFRKASEQPPAPPYQTELCPRQRHFSSISKPATNR